MTVLGRPKYIYRATVDKRLTPSPPNEGSPGGLRPPGAPKVVIATSTARESNTSEHQFQTRPSAAPIPGRLPGPDAIRLRPAGAEDQERPRPAGPPPLIDVIDPARGDGAPGPGFQASTGSRSRAG